MSNDDETEEKKDLTKITDLSEFLHEDDPETDRLLKESAELTESTSSTSEDLPSIDDLDNEEEELINEFAEEQDDGQDESPPSFELEEDSFEESTEPLFSTDDETDTSFGSDSFETDSESTEFDSGSDFSEESTDFSDESSDFSNESADFSDESTNFGEEEQGDFDQFSDKQDDSDQFDLGGDFSEETEGFSEDSSQFEEEESTEDTETMDFGVQDELSEEEQEEEATQTEDYNFTPEFTQTEISAPQVEASTPVPTVTEKKRVPPENFQDLRDFGNSITYGKVSLGGNPPFSIIVRGIIFEEDAEDILIILREHGLVDDSNEKDMKIGLEQGSIIISQISEYSAIYLCHRLRRFNLSIEMGLSDEIYQSKSYKQEGRGLVSKYNLKQNISEDIIVERSDLKTEDILVTTTPLLEGHRIIRYVDIVSSHTIVKEDELHRLHQAQLLEKEDDKDFENSEEEDRLKKFSLGLNQIYHELGDELKNEAFKIEANAIVGLNYQITPLLTSFSDQSQGEYKITCTGNAVWVSQD